MCLLLKKKRKLLKKKSWSSYFVKSNIICLNIRPPGVSNQQLLHSLSHSPVSFSKPACTLRHPPMSNVTTLFMLSFTCKYTCITNNLIILISRTSEEIPQLWLLLFLYANLKTSIYLLQACGSGPTSCQPFYTKHKGSTILVIKQLYGR